MPSVGQTWLSHGESPQAPSPALMRLFDHLSAIYSDLKIAQPWVFDRRPDFFVLVLLNLKVLYLVCSIKETSFLERAMKEDEGLPPTRLSDWGSKLKRGLIALTWDYLLRSHQQ